MSKVIVENTMRYAKKRTPADQKCDKFAQAVNIEVCSSQSESESISEEGDTYAESGHISQTREEESEQNSRPKEKFGSRGPQSTHWDVWQGNGIMMKMIGKVFQKFESEDETDWNKKRASRKLNIGVQ